MSAVHAANGPDKGETENRILLVESSDHENRLRNPKDSSKSFTLIETKFGLVDTNGVEEENGAENRGIYHPTSI